MSDFPLLNVFLSYAREDNDKVSAFYKKLKKEGWIKPWRDEEDLLKGKKWKYTISDYIENEAHVVLVFLSKQAVNKLGYFQDEMKRAVDKARSMPEGDIFIVPIILEDCTIPQMLREYNCADYKKSTKNNYEKILKSLKEKAKRFGISTMPPPKKLLVEMIFDDEYVNIKNIKIGLSRLLVVAMEDITNFPKKGKRSRPIKLLVKLTERAEYDLRLELENSYSEYYLSLKYHGHNILGYAND